ncbi:competence type IV pilus major pilin ComGC [Fredinandcohnia sp. 179-A 10B2 NHS]|uniref:competence type IV pilus major pilin ComGC n=1 Tax=Fredinandcohnia sp. 179-A 10B2 NHS TaxID=3235176 RepID=UPI00399F7374
MNQKGFTLIEMLIVLLVISILLLVTVPNVTKHNSMINEKGCEALIKMVQAQVQAYEIDKNKEPVSISELQTEKYLDGGDPPACPNGSSLTIEEGIVKEVTAVAEG